MPTALHRDGLAPSRLSLPPGHWATVLDCLCAQFPAIGRAQWLDRMARGLVLDAAGAAVDAQRPYRAGLEIRYYREVQQEPQIPFTETVLHADAQLVVVDKPHFLPVTPSGGYVQQTLLARLIRRLGNAQLAPLHRIDSDTAGLVLFSADAATRGAYQALFRERRMHKRYEALAPPLPQREFPLLYRSRLARGEPFFRSREVPGEPNSETRIELLSDRGALWHYALYPLTGRKHQLRVHLAALGAPIAHDPLYPELAQRADDFARPLQLLAQELAFDDPLSGAPRRFVSAMRLSGV